MNKQIWKEKKNQKHFVGYLSSNELQLILLKTSLQIWLACGKS